MRYKLSFLFFLICFSLKLAGQSQPVITVDTLSITLAQAEEQFVKNNYLLLSQKYNVDASKALIRQAGLLNNPNLYYENSIFNKFSGKYFPTRTGTWGDYTTQGEFLVQFNWLFSIAGKRNKTVKVAQAQAEVAQFQFDDLIRTLLFALRSDFYQLHYGLRSLKIIDQEINSLNQIVSGFETQYKNGNISLRELTRIRALSFSLQNDKLALYTNLQAVHKEFSVLLNNNKTAWYKTEFAEAEADGRFVLSKVILADIEALAIQSRPDLKAAAAQLKTAEASLSLQKAIAVPDITVQGVFDRNGSYIPNYNAVALGIPLAIFNRNQGNVQAAKSIVEANKQFLLQKQTGVKNDVFSAYQKIAASENLASTVNADFSKDFNSVFGGMQSNFEKKNISLLEFVDFFESYKQSMMQLHNIKAQRYTSYEELIFSVGADVFKK